ncbi:MAG: hypothetical protein LC799_31430, partial [Actinobacteria bacterium]|nr:hypothetical protein [Actinomycetota bacterium]
MNVPSCRWGEVVEAKWLRRAGDAAAICRVRKIAATAEGRLIDYPRSDGTRRSGYEGVLNLGVIEDADRSRRGNRLFEHVSLPADRCPARPRSARAR